MPRTQERTIIALTKIRETKEFLHIIDNAIWVSENEINVVKNNKNIHPNISVKIVVFPLMCHWFIDSKNGLILFEKGRKKRPATRIVSMPNIT